MKKIGMLMLLGITLGCKKPYTGDYGTSVSLLDFKPLTGVHCESSALLNSLNHQGYSLNESEILGAGAVLGFIYQKSKFPFLGGRTLELKENLFNNLKINWHKENSDDDSLGWSKIYTLIDSDYPVILRVDMRYLPYLHGGKFGSKYTSFGWHVITLASIDIENKIAFVTDTNLEGLQKINLKDLNKARFSNLDVMPPKGEFYWIDKAPKNFSVNWEEVTYKSLIIIKNNMFEIISTNDELIGLNGMRELPLSMKNLNKTTPSYLLEPVLGFLYGSIETNGTGGAAFRNQYLLFLKEQSKLNKNLGKYVELLTNSVNAWDNFSNYLKVMSVKGSNKDFNKLSELANKVYIAENKFYKEIN